MLTGQSGCALLVKYRPLLRVSRRKACPFLEVQLPRFQQGGAAESDPVRTLGPVIVSFACCHDFLDDRYREGAVPHELHKHHVRLRYDQFDEGRRGKDDSRDDR